MKEKEESCSEIDGIEMTAHNAHGVTKEVDESRTW